MTWKKRSPPGDGRRTSGNVRFCDDQNGTQLKVPHQDLQAYAVAWLTRL